MNKIDNVSRAIRFEGPQRVPIELVDVPGIYNAYGTCDADRVAMIPGAQDFDAAWVTYHWTLTDEGANAEGERLRRDEWGCLQRVPDDPASAYVIVERPLPDADDLRGYTFPDPAVADPFFDRVARVIRERYPDRFITAYVDPGPFLVAFNLFGYDGLLLRLATDIELVKEVIARIFAYQRELVPRFKAAGAHMINVIDEFAGTGGMMFAPGLWREHFKPAFADFMRYVHKEGLLTGLLLDGDVTAIFDDLLEMEIDVVQFVQPRACGIDRIAETFAGKRCVKCSVDMMETLATGTPDEVKAEARRLVETFHGERGGFIANVLRWHRPEYPPANVAASAEAFNEFR